MARKEPSTVEVEIKLRFDSADAAVREIEKLGGEPVGERELEDNRVYDLPDGSLRRSGRLLRLRTHGASSVLTFKAKVEGESRHKVYEEHETRVDDPAEAHRILSALGYAPWYRYQKYRRTYLLAAVEVAVDETPIGCFVELEGEPDAIDELAGRLGFAPPDYLRETYRELHESEAAAVGEAAGDLVFSDRAG